MVNEDAGKIITVYHKTSLSKEGQMMVKTYRNKKSGRYFIHLEEIDANSGLFINGDTNPRILRLPYAFFDSPTEEETLLSSKRIAGSQLEFFNGYQEAEESAPVERFLLILEEVMTPAEIKDFFLSRIKEIKGQEMTTKKEGGCEL